MPRGVYKRKGRQQAAGGPSAPKAQANPAQAAAPQAAADSSAPCADVVTPPPADPTPVGALSQGEPRKFTREDFRRSVDDMDGELLRAYARSIGILQRDVDRLTEDRLRQNCKARLIHAAED